LSQKNKLNFKRSLHQKKENRTLVVPVLTLSQTPNIFMVTNPEFHGIQKISTA
jgi:hypothetical protein